MLELRTWHIDLFRLSAICDEYGGPLSASNISSKVLLRRRKRFSRNRFPLSPWLVVRRRPSGPRLTARPVYVCIYSPFRTTLRWEGSTKLQLCFQINNRQEFFHELKFSLVPNWSTSFRTFESQIRVPRVEIPQDSLFPASSIFISSRPTNGVSRCLDPGFRIPASICRLKHRKFSKCASSTVMFFWPATNTQTTAFFHMTLLTVEGKTGSFSCPGQQRLQRWKEIQGSVYSSSMCKLGRNRQDEAPRHWLVTASVKMDRKLCFLLFRQSSETSMFQKSGHV